MKSGLWKYASVGFVVLALQFSASAEDQTLLTNQTEKISYSVGMSIAASIKRAGFEIDPDVLAAAIRDVLSGHETKMTDQEAQQNIMAYQKELRAKRDAERLKIAVKNRKEGDEFLADNKKKEGVKTLEVKLPEGGSAEMQYKIINEGTGEPPKPTDTAVINDKGTLIDGKEFDSSTNRTVVVNRIPMRGLTEALQMMKPGSKWQIYLPSTLAFGDYQMGSNVEPGSTVIYDVELVSVQTPQPLTSDIIRVPSAEDLKKGSNIVRITPEELKKMQMSQTNSSSSEKK
jgi:FKBP-type peptidyl-prolyl cis-trans isomerase FklB